MGRGAAAPARLGLTLVAGASWLYLVYMVGGMANMDVPAAQWLMPAMTHWGAADLALVFLMWSIMMAAMMLPSAAPMVQVFARGAEAQTGYSTGLLTNAFVAGYLAVWTAFSALITLAQWGLLELRLVTATMESASGWLSGILLVAAGVFQFSPLKHACLNKCRTPLGFLMAEGGRPPEAAEEAARPRTGAPGGYRSRPSAPIGRIARGRPVAELGEGPLRGVRRSPTHARQASAQPTLDVRSGSTTAHRPRPEARRRSSLDREPRVVGRRIRLGRLL